MLEERHDTTKPSLHDIANLPLSKTRRAIHEHYDPNFGLVDEETGEYIFYAKASWQVIEDHDEKFKVTAMTEEEARGKINDHINDGSEIEDLDIDIITKPKNEQWLIEL